MQTTCRSCNSKQLNSILFLGNFFLSDFVDNTNKPAQYPLSLILCSQCKLLQLKHTTPPALLYTEHYGYKSGINKTMRDELRQIVEKAVKSVKNSKQKFICVDIGANDGTLLSYYSNSFIKVAFEPVQKLANECKNHAEIVINNFFNYDDYKHRLHGDKAIIITAISCFYDIDNPNEFLANVTKILHKEGVFIIQQNYVASMLRLNAFDNIVHEHLEYYSLLSLQNLLSRHNLEVYDVELSPINGGSFRTYIAFKGQHKISKRVFSFQQSEKKLRLDNKKTYINFAKRIKSNKRKVYIFIKNLVKNGAKVYVYGASTRGNTLLQYYGLNNRLISYAVERNPEKWGKKIASVNIPIISEAQARRERPDYMLVLPWFFREEFLQREKKYLKNGGHFIFPLPKFELI